MAHVIITHKNIRPYLDRLQREPEFKIGTTYKGTGDEWYRQRVRLEFPTGEAAKDGLSALALLGARGEYKTEALTGHEGFNAQGLEGKIVVEKELFSALMNLRDLLPEGRGRIVLKNSV